MACTVSALAVPFGDVPSVDIELPSSVSQQSLYVSFQGTTCKLPFAGGNSMFMQVTRKIRFTDITLFKSNEKLYHEQEVTSL
jgi:hypothetical protein